MTSDLMRSTSGLVPNRDDRQQPRTTPAYCTDLDLERTLGSGRAADSANRLRTREEASSGHSGFGYQCHSMETVRFQAGFCQKLRRLEESARFIGHCLRVR